MQPEAALAEWCFPIIFNHVVEWTGYALACRVLAFIVMGTQVVPLTGAVAGQRRKLMGAGALKVPSFLLFSTTLFLTFTGLYIPFSVSAYGESELSVNTTLAFYVLNAGSFFSRIALNLLAKRLDALAACAGCAGCAGYADCMIVSGASCLIWIPIHSLAGLVAWAVLYGFFSGALVSLAPTTMVAISSDPIKFATRLGMASAFAGFGLVIGNSLGGAIATSRLSFTGLWLFCWGGRLARGASGL